MNTFTENQIKKEHFVFNGSLVEYYNKNKICFWCKKHFEPKQHRSIICSDECRVEYYSMRKKVKNNFIKKCAKNKEITDEIILDRIKEIYAKD